MTGINNKPPVYTGIKLLSSLRHPKIAGNRKDVKFEHCSKNYLAVSLARQGT